MAGVCRIKKVKTRKVHICDSCKKTIPVGSVAENFSGLAVDEDGAKPFSLYYCPKCIEEDEEED